MSASRTDVLTVQPPEYFLTEAPENTLAAFRKAVEAGYGIAYVAQAKVYHSHNYTYRQQFRRNFDLGVSQADHPEVFAAYPSESEGIRLVKSTVEHLKKKGMRSKIPDVIIQSGFKYTGYVMGKRYRRLPGRLILKLSSNREYWR